MLGDKDVIAHIAVKDMDKVGKFYSEVLGLKKHMEIPGYAVYKSGNSALAIYESGTAGTNQATAVGWAVDDINSVVDDLKSKGVSFEHYDNMPNVKLEGDLHSMGEGNYAAWFKDPEGNILSIFTT